MTRAWQDPLFRLHAAGWNSDDIDEACEALYEACSEGQYEGRAIESLTAEETRSALGIVLDNRLAAALQQIASTRSQRNADADALQRALYDLDAFAYEFAGDT